MQEIFDPLFQNAKEVLVNAAGELFISKHSRELVKKISQNYPQIKFDIITNGILCDKKNLEELGIIDKLNKIIISFHATKEKTYNQLVKNGDFKKVMENISTLSEMKKQGMITTLSFNFVMTSINYKEMKDFVKLAQKLDATASFLELNYLPYLKNCDYEKLSVTNVNHPRYNDFVKILKDPIFRSENCIINNYLLELKSENIFSKLKKIISGEQKC